MIDRSAARSIATAYTRGICPPDDELVISDDDTIETAYGWVFFYDSKRFLETGAFEYMLAGNGPPLVEKSDGSVHPLTSALPVDEAIRDYERAREQ